jgi:flavin reductase (DIM6/NTAB) family NADH-FMN oxidoreductase RutF
MPVPEARFREIFAELPTAVAVVTAVGEDGIPRGLTCNAVCSVSMSPSLLLVCVDKRSQTLPAITEARAFVVNFLADDRAPVSDRFAGKAPDKFAGLRWVPAQGAGGAPVLTDAIAAAAECRVEAAIEAGDHWIFVGRVEDVVLAGRPALMYFRREYASAGQLTAAAR